MPHPASDWPNALDLFAIFGFLAAALLLPAAGYLLMALDVRAHYRSLRRRLVHVVMPQLSRGWACGRPPQAFATLGISPPCTEEELKQAYREKVKQLHPDTGGDPHRFLRLQAHFEEALEWIRQRERAS
ncbi:MAG: J domain-containing protein [Pirellulales bacterium]